MRAVIRDTEAEYDRASCGICCVNATHLSVHNHVLLALRFVRVLLKPNGLID